MKQKGFTLIELVVVIVILGILAAVALPKFMNFGTDAGNAAAQGVAGALSSASAMNYGKYQISSGSATMAVTSGTTTCSQLNALLAGGALPDHNNWSAGTNTITCAGGAGGTDTTNCSIVNDNGTTAAKVTVTCTN